MFWLSFADPNLPKGNQFLGACIVDGDTFEQSVKESIKLGINPGGEVVGLNIDDCYVDKINNKMEDFKNVLLDKHQCSVFDLLMTQMDN